MIIWCCSRLNSQACDPSLKLRMLVIRIISNETKDIWTFGEFGFAPSNMLKPGININMWLDGSGKNEQARGRMKQISCDSGLNTKATQNWSVCYFACSEYICLFCVTIVKWPLSKSHFVYLILLLACSLSPISGHQFMIICRSNILFRTNLYFSWVWIWSETLSHCFQFKWQHSLWISTSATLFQVICWICSSRTNAEMVNHLITSGSSWKIKKLAD